MESGNRQIQFCTFEDIKDEKYRPVSRTLQLKGAWLTGIDRLKVFNRVKPLQSIGHSDDRFRATCPGNREEEKAEHPTSVAHHAKVSIATVSRTINRVPSVDKKLAKRVFAAIEEFNYYP